MSFTPSTRSTGLNRPARNDTSLTTQHRSSGVQARPGPATNLSVVFDPRGVLRDNPDMPSPSLYRAMKQQYKLAYRKKMPEGMKYALRPMPHSTIDGRSVTRMERAARGDSEFHTHVKTPERNALINENSFVPNSKQRLSNGQHNTVYLCQFRQKEVDGTRQGAAQAQIIKTAGPMLMSSGPLAGQPAPMARLSGIDYEHPRTPDRNMATAVINGELGTTSVPNCSAGVLEGKVCLAMDKVPGDQALGYLRQHPDVVRNPDLQRQMSDIEVNAYLCGNPDPNPTNVLIHDDGRGGLTATMIDNDMSFGPAMNNPDQPPGRDDPDVLYNQTGLPAFMDAKTCDAVRRMDVDQVAAKLDKHLTPEEVAAFRDRAAALKTHVEFLAANDRVISDWHAWQTPDGKPGQGGDFFTGTMQMAPVQFANGENIRVTPRSLLCREMMRPTSIGYFSSLPEMAKLKYADQPLVPPSGIDPLVGRDRTAFGVELPPREAPQPPPGDSVPRDASTTSPSVELYGVQFEVPQLVGGDGVRIPVTPHGDANLDNASPRPQHGLSDVARRPRRGEPARPDATDRGEPARSASGENMYVANGLLTPQHDLTDVARQPQRGEPARPAATDRAESARPASGENMYVANGLLTPQHDLTDVARQPQRGGPARPAATYRAESARPAPQEEMYLNNR